MPNLRRSDVARVLLSLDGVAIGLTGVVAIMGSTAAFQGEGILLLVAGIALVAFGIMVVLRWKLRAVKTGLIGMTAGYFAAALAEFEVATDPCDIGAHLERCVDHVVGGLPWAVYQGPLILAVLLFFLLVLEPETTNPGGQSD